MKAFSVVSFLRAAVGVMSIDHADTMGDANSYTSVLNDTLRPSIKHLAIQHETFLSKYPTEPMKNVDDMELAAHVCFESGGACPVFQSCYGGSRSAKTLGQCRPAVWTVVIITLVSFLTMMMIVTLLSKTFASEQEDESKPLFRASRYSVKMP
eukprot:GEMP01060388.1.p1 GENE.GEMP01060388.1~~GEMP01060388.1.p1  ORF type:complete len:153 (+),score=15.87 GEMP01060388.1:112-570(+)